MFDYKAFQESLVTTFEHEFNDEIKHEPSGWFIELATAAHDEAQRKVRNILDSMDKRKASSLAHSEKDGVELIAARIVGWRGIEAPYSHELAVQFLTGAKAESLRRQLVEAMGDATRPFTPKTPGTS